MEPKERKPFRWRTWHFALIFVLNILLVCTADCLLHFPITGSVYASPPEALHPRLKSSQIIQYDLIDNICAITFRDQQGTVCFLALEQYGPISRCRVLEDDAPPPCPGAITSTAAPLP